MNWSLILQLLIALAGATGISGIIQAWRTRRSRGEVKVEVAAQLNDMALKYVDEMQADALAARAEAKAAREELTNLHLSLQKALRDADTLGRRLASLTRAINSATATMDELRAMVADATDTGGK